MTIDFSSDAAMNNRREPASAEYPQATFRDKSTTASNDGTPIAIAKNLKDWDGFRQALIALGKITPSGDPDTALVSQLMDALQTWYGGILRVADSGSTSSTIFNRARAEISSGYIRHSKIDGTLYKLRSSLQNGGVYFSGTSPSTRSILMRREFYDIDSTEISYNATTQHISWIPSGSGFTLTGIPQNSKIEGCGIETRSAASGGTLQDSPVATSMDMSGTYPLVQKAVGPWSGTASIPSAVCRFWVDYDPTYVD